MVERTIFERVDKAWEIIGGKCSKYVGALTVEIIRQALQDNGIPVSARDVFIRGIPIEFDLLIPRHGATCLDEILYEPKDVIAVLEIKTSGLFDYTSKNRIEACREKVRIANSNIFYGYVTLTERQSFQEKIFEGNIPDWVFTLSWYKQVKGKDTYDELRESWPRLLKTLHSLI